MLSLRLPLHPVKITTLALLASLVAVPASWGQGDDEVRPDVTDLDRMAVRQAVNVHRHVLPTNLNNGKGEHRSKLPGARVLAARAQAAAASSRGLRYPGDLFYLGGPVVDSAQSHAIYMLPNGTCPISTCWGNPEGFLRALGQSEFVHVVDQYVGLFGSQRYGVGTHASLKFTPRTTPFTDADMQAVVHAVAKALGKTGYGHIYHVFLPQGTDECFDSTFSECYSPDNFNTFYYCAYHSSVDFTDIGHVLYSVEPYQNAVGCNVRPGTPNGPLVDSTNNVLSHETFETITDPDGNAWWNLLDNGLYGEEIGDECAFLAIVGNSLLFDPSLFRAEGKVFAAQPEYDNSAHACSTGPGGD